MPNEDEIKTKIRKLNDEFRRSMNPRLGRCVMTRGVAELSELERIAVVQKTRLFNNFNEENDPHGEHDFGIIKMRGESVYFKIDYFDKALEYGSEDQSDPEKTTRMMTLMLACEY